jgi:hypothetical protein
MQSQQNTSQLEFKILRKDDKYDLNVVLLEAFYRMKFIDNLETVLGKDELLDKSTVIKFEKDFVNKCFYCGCINSQSGIAVSYFIIRKISLSNFFIQMKQQFGSKNMSKQATALILQAFLNGLQPHERILIYDDDNGSFIQLSQSISIDRINEFINSFQKFGFFNFFKQDNKSDSLDILFNAIKRIIRGQNTKIRFFYTLNDDANFQITNNNYEVILCKKENRKTYAICSTTPFIQAIKNKAPKNYRYFKKIYNFVGL